MDTERLKDLHNRLIPLANFLKQRRPRISSGMSLAQNKRRRVRSGGNELTALQEEERSLSALHALVNRTAQALSLISIVIADDRFSRIADMLPSVTRKELAQVRHTSFFLVTTKPQRRDDDSPYINLSIP